MTCPPAVLGSILCACTIVLAAATSCKTSNNRSATAGSSSANEQRIRDTGDNGHNGSSPSTGPGSSGKPDPFDGPSFGTPPSAMVANPVGLHAAQGLRASTNYSGSHYFGYFLYHGSQLLVDAGSSFNEPDSFPAPIAPALVISAYCRVLGRTPNDYEMPPYNLNTNVVYTVKAMIADLVDSPEYESRFINARPPNEQLYNLYSSLMARSPDDSDPNNAAALNNLQSRSYRDVAQQLLETPEYKANFGNDRVPGSGRSGCGGA